MNDRLLDAAEVAELLHIPTSWVRAETRAGHVGRGLDLAREHGGAELTSSGEWKADA
jgi:hypothetical protein